IHGSEYMGVYQDIKTPPTGTTETQFAAEADAFATAHGLTGDVNAQIVIATQSGTCPNGFGSGGICPSGGQYCAWHTNSVNTGVTFTNLPYLLDANDCGQNFVNVGNAGLYDGFSIVEGHEYAETITDPVPGTGWIDTADQYGGEIGDKCAWGGSIWGGSAPYGDVTLSTGTFAMQSLWNNAAGACTMSPTTDTLTVTSPGSQTMTVGQSVSLQIKASSSTGAKLEYYAAGLPAGLSIDASTGLITGKPAATGTGSATVTADDTTGAISTATFTWTVNQAPDTVTVTSPGTQTTTAGQSVSLQIKASSSTGATLTYQAAGLPTGLAIDTSTGLITGTPNTPGTGSVTLTVTDTTGGKGTATFTWTINPVPPPPPATFRIKGYKSECVTDYGYLSAPGTRAVINPCNNLLREKWTTGTGNSLKINGLCLTDPRWGRWGTKLVLDPCTGFKNQNWTLHANGEYTIAVHGLCLTDPRWSTTSGTQLIIQSCRDWANQRWTKD
ncbi:MAG: putative Ig domain-containing protein, partial [Actinomycetota bacterium]|nr:putative Ig domain-containing protein [Actinomycetota bacterium]